jgi:hypothetical protein
LEVLATSVAAQQALPGSADQNFRHDAEVGKNALDVIIPSSMNPQTSIVSIVVQSQVRRKGGKLRNGKSSPLIAHIFSLIQSYEIEKGEMTCLARAVFLKLSPS